MLWRYVMGLSVVESALNFDLTTLSSLKLELGISNSDTTYDAVLNLLITQASAACARYSETVFALQTYKEVVPGWGDQYIMLSRTPLVPYDGTQDVIVTLDSEPVVGVEIFDAETGTLFYSSGFTWTAQYWWGINDQKIRGHESPRFAITYKAGYVLPGDAGTVTLPANIERACIVTAATWFKDAGGEPELRRKRVGDLELEYFSKRGRVMGIPAEAVTLLPAPLVK
jgi:hypothetical protein